MKNEYCIFCGKKDVLDPFITKETHEVAEKAFTERVITYSNKCDCCSDHKTWIKSLKQTIVDVHILTELYVYPEIHNYLVLGKAYLLQYLRAVGHSTRIEYVSLELNIQKIYAEISWAIPHIEDTQHGYVLMAITHYLGEYLEVLEKDNDYS